MTRLQKFLLVFFGFISITFVFYTKVNVQNYGFSFLNFSIESNEERWDSNIAKVKIETSFVFVDSTRDVQNVCALPVYDFWYDAVKNVMSGSDPTRNCDRNFKPWTVLSNGSWDIVRDGANCSARCMEGNGAKRHVAVGKWMKPGKVSCEFLEAVCWENGTEVYGWIHTQLVPKSRLNIKTPVSSEKQANVYIFSIDSMGTGMAKRSLPKFLEFFRSEYSGVEFPFVNKVGENTKPNAIPLYFGKTIEKARKVSWEELKADWNFTEYCETFLDNYTSIFNDFEREGFMTLSLEDWMPTMVDAWPTCKGFQFAPAHHTFRPFASTLEAYGTHVTKQHLNGKLCRETHHAILEYLEQSFEPYKDRPVFAWTWLINIAHNHVDGVARIDQFLVDYFRRNKKNFENSFVIFASDHGFRFGGHLGTELGRFERDNPYLNIALPKSLRDRKFRILETLKANSLKLQTHFDTRATLLDILKYQPKAKFMDRDPIRIPNEKGNSLIRRQPPFPRTCATLPIPRQYCICQVEKFQILNDTLKFHLGHKLLDHVHDLLDKSNYTSICRKYELEKVTLLEFGYTKTWNTYNIEVKTASPSRAHFQTMMTYDGNNDSVNFEKIVRLDSYGKTPDCTAPIRHDPLCYCKVQPKN